MRRFLLLLLTLVVVLCCTGSAFCAGGLVTGSRTAAGCQVKVVEANLSDYSLRVGLAENRVGLTESLAGIAKRFGAVAAVNGSFFDAYSKKPVRNPYQTLITDGKMVHRGDVGALLGVWPDGEARIAKMTTRLLGGLDGCTTWPDNWFSYWLNRLPENPTAVTIFTPKYGGASTPAGGTQITVCDGTVTKIGSESRKVPGNGYVIYISGSEASLAQRFKVGRRCEWRVSYNPADGSTGWDKVKEGMGGYPMLVADGKILMTGASVTRGVTSEGSNRSAVGLKPGGKVIFVTTGSLTLLKLATAMKSLGCTDAINLDGGASSGLYLSGAYLTKPGRDLSSALLLVKK